MRRGESNSDAGLYPVETWTLYFFRGKIERLKGMESDERVVVMGGGSTGTGIARDLAMRGVPTTLIEVELLREAYRRDGKPSLREK